MRLEDRIFHISMRRGNVGTSACSVRGFYSRKSRQSRQRLRAIFREIREREIITLVFSSDAARNVPTPSPLTTLLLRICYSLFLSIRVCDPTTENMFFCSSVKRSHNSSLKMFFCRKNSSHYRKNRTLACRRRYYR